MQSALDWWAAQDDMGGFRTAAAALFPGWLPRRCCRAPHREDRAPSFSLYRNARGEWRFKDHATGERGVRRHAVALNQFIRCRDPLSSNKGGYL